MLLLLLTACNPWSEVHDREAPWWGSAAALERATGHDLIELPAGEPVGYWPRLVVGMHAIEVDNRAWFLSLPPQVFEDAEAEEELRGLLVEARLELQGGRVAPGSRRGMLITPLYDVLMELVDSAKSIGERYEGAPFEDQVLVLPAPGVPAETLSQVIYTAGQAQLGSAALGGVVDDRVRRVVAEGDALACADMLTVEAGQGGAILRAAGYSLSPDGACPSAQTGATLERLTSLCAPRWEALAAAAAAAHPELEPLPAERWRCVALLTGLSGSGQAGDLLLALSQAHALHPAVRQSFYMGGAGGEPGCGEVLDLSQPLEAATLDAICGAQRFTQLLDAWASGDPRAGRGFFLPILKPPSKGSAAQLDEALDLGSLEEALEALDGGPP